MVIGEAAGAAGLSAKMVRHYERIGLLRPAARTEAGYRIYSAADVETLRFIRRARGLGLSLPRIQTLLSLWQDRGRASEAVKRIALDHAAELRTRIAEMTAVVEAIEGLAASCHGDQRPDCPILQGLSGAAPIRTAAPPG